MRRASWRSKRELLFIFTRECLRETGTYRGTVQQTHVGSFRQTGNTAHHRESWRTADHRSQSHGKCRRSPSRITDGHREDISRLLEEKRALYGNFLCSSARKVLFLNGLRPSLKRTRSSIETHHHRHFFSSKSRFVNYYFSSNVTHGLPLRHGT